LVRSEDLARALAALQARGYTRADEYRTAAEAPWRDSFTFCRGTAVGDLHVEMHVGLHRSNGRLVFPAEDIWARARPLDVLGARVYGMEPGDLLLYLPWHARTHAFRRIAWLYDVALVTQAFGSSVDWDDVARR